MNKDTYIYIQYKQRYMNQYTHTGIERQMDTRKEKYRDIDIQIEIYL